MFYPARWKKRTVDQSKVLKTGGFFFGGGGGATRYSEAQNVVPSQTIDFSNEKKQKDENYSLKKSEKNSELSDFFL